jgi:RNA polymerase sigma-70 factor (ECF subfamily)
MSLVTTDEQLMADVKAGSERACETLFARYREPVWGFFRRRVPDSRRAEELAQDTFVAILQAAPRYEPRGALRSYIFGIAYNILVADRRRDRRADSVPLADDPPAGPAADPSLALWVRDALARLDADDREILMLREYEDLSYQEIADVRAMPLNTVRSRLFRARMALRAALEARHAGVGHERD